MTNKVNRNDPCPCGSGKKFKVCCMQKSKPSGGQSLGLRKFTAKVISSGNMPKVDPEAATPPAPPKAFMDYTKIMEKSYGDVFNQDEEAPPLPNFDSDFTVKKDS